MPSKNKPKSVCLRPTILGPRTYLRLILTLAPVAIILSFILKLSDERLPPSQTSKKSDPDNPFQKTEIVDISGTKDKFIPKYRSNPATEKDEWCQARDYIDLSGHQIFDKFNEWVSDYKLLQCLNEQNCTSHPHDPRILKSFTKAVKN